MTDTARIADLERRVLQLERVARQQLPMPWPLPLDEDRNCCSVCGLRFEGSMGYVCANPTCPSAVIYTSHNNET